MTETTRENRIRERAHHIWERAGSPDGQEAEHWRQAEAEIMAEDAEVEPVKKPAKKSRKKA